MVVYLPVAFVSGNVGQLFRELGLTIVVATLFFSLLVSYTLTPMLAARLAGRVETRGDGAVTRLGEWFARHYPGLVAHAHVQNPFISSGARAASVSVLGPDLTELDRRRPR